MQGLKDVKDGLWNNMAGKTNAVKSISSFGAGAVKALTGDFHGAGQAADKSWNSDTLSANRETARAASGMQQAGNGFNNMLGAAGNYIGNIGRAFTGQQTQPYKPTPAPSPQPTSSAPAPSNNTPSARGYGSPDFAVAASRTLGPGAFRNYQNLHAGMSANANQLNAAGKTSGSFVGGQLQGPGVVPNASAQAASQAAVGMGNPDPLLKSSNQSTNLNTMNQRHTFSALGHTKSAYGVMPLSDYAANAGVIPQKPGPFANARRRGGVAPAAIAGRQSTGASPSAPPEVRNAVAVQANQLAAFRKDTGTDYDPNSKTDAVNLQRLIGGSQTFDRNQYNQSLGQQKVAYDAFNALDDMEKEAFLQKAIDGAWNSTAKPIGQQIGRAVGGVGSTIGGVAKGIWNTPGQNYGIQKTAFASLEKEAGVGKLVTGIGEALVRSGRNAKLLAREAEVGALGLTPSHTAQHVASDIDGVGKTFAKLSPEARAAAEQQINAAGKGVGSFRRYAGQQMRGAGKGMSQFALENPLTTAGLKYGGGTALAGAGLYGSNRMGHSSGRQEGITEGVDQGMELGMQGAQAMQPGDPGFLGRLGDLFTGTQQGPPTAQMRQQMAGSRDQLIQALINGGH